MDGDMRRTLKGEAITALLSKEVAYSEITDLFWKTRLFRRGIMERAGRSPRETAPRLFQSMNQRKLKHTRRCLGRFFGSESAAFVLRATPIGGHMSDHDIAQFGAGGETVNTLTKVGEGFPRGPTDPATPVPEWASL
jgi:hypothetical protein